MGAPGFEDLAGTELPAGRFTITEEENRMVLDVVAGDPSEDGTAHPLWAYIATQRGIAVSVAELCALADFDVNDGPMLGSVELELDRPIAIGVPYTVTGEIVDVARKHGRSGTFDVMTFTERLVGEDGERIASSTNTFILPRREI